MSARGHQDEKVKLSVYTNTIAAGDRYTSFYKAAATNAPPMVCKRPSRTRRSASVYTNTIAAGDRYTSFYKAASDERSAYGLQEAIKDEKVKQASIQIRLRRETAYTSFYKAAADERSAYGLQEASRMRRSSKASIQIRLRQETATRRSIGG